MTSDESRRFTDREVALVLRKASEIEESEGTDGRGGLSARDLEEIAREVGISQLAITQAIASLERGETSRRSLLSAPATHRTIRAVEGELSEEAVRRLVRLIDERADQAGVVSEALGSVRWTGSDRIRSTQVSITPEGGETRIQVVEKLAPRIRGAVHGIPIAWGVMIAGPLVEQLGLSGAGLAAVVALGAAAGLAAGRVVWGIFSAKSRARVERLTADLTQTAREAAAAGLLAESGGDE
jgi:hypothetical protein